MTPRMKVKPRVVFPNPTMTHIFPSQWTIYENCIIAHALSLWNKGEPMTTEGDGKFQCIDKCEKNWMKIILICRKEIRFKFKFIRWRLTKRHRFKRQSLRFQICLQLIVLSVGKAGENWEIVHYTVGVTSTLSIFHISFQFSVERSYVKNFLQIFAEKSLKLASNQSKPFLNHS